MKIDCRRLSSAICTQTEKSHQNSSAALGKASRWLWMERGDAWSCCFDTNCWVAQVREFEDQRPETPDDACSFIKDV